MMSDPEMAQPHTPTITRIPVVSSDLAEVGYDAQTQTLEVAFHRGNSVYRYYDVPQDVHTELMATPSIGRYFAHHIKRGPAAYRYERVGGSA